MTGRVTLWVRDDEESRTARSFLSQNGYRPDETRTLEPSRWSDAQWETFRKALPEGLWSLVDLRHPRYGELLPRGAEDQTDETLRSLLAANPGLVKTPILLTPKGAVCGFREQRWRSFLDIRFA